MAVVGAMDAIYLIWYSINSFLNNRIPYLSDVVNASAILQEHSVVQQYMFVLALVLQLSIFASCAMFLLKKTVWWLVFFKRLTACVCYSVCFTSFYRRANCPALQRAVNAWIDWRIGDSKNLERVAMEQKMLMLLSERAFSLRYVPAPVRILHHLVTATLVSLRDDGDDGRNPAPPGWPGRTADLKPKLIKLCVWFACDSEVSVDVYLDWTAPS